MSITETYNELGENPVFPKKELRTKIQLATGKSEATVFRYLSGKVVPDKPTKEVIAKIMNKEVNQLWPDSTEKTREEV